MSIQIYVVRHGVAEPKDARAHDEDRRLTPAGRRELRRVVKGLKDAGVRFDAVYTSPWVRARQTAAELKPLCRNAAIETEELARRPRTRLLRQLEGKTVAVVGHEPWLTQLLAWFCTGKIRGARAYVLEKAGVARLVGPRKAGRLKLVGLWAPSDF